ncbi:MAG: ATP-binding protein [Armatimonadetes bacterium]|nr:ATP-binding protein [Armatimonadota bacterium]
MPFEILPPSLAIKSMRSSGYRDTAHAIAELIDNSIEAGTTVNECTTVEVICVDRRMLVGQQDRRQIDEIAVYDNASGMDANTLQIALQFGNGTHLTEDQQKGIGKFGMGLPNASISQCRRVDVYSWQRGEVLHSYLDVDMIERGHMREVPAPVAREIPAFWKNLIQDVIGPHGTLVIWSRLDRVSWRRSKTLLDNTEFLAGRIYRYFLAEGKARIRLAAFEVDGVEAAQPLFERMVRPNDPLYLMKHTSAPEPYDEQPAFDDLGEQHITVRHAGKAHTVRIRFSVVGTRARSEGGSSPIGKHAAKNVGISLVRAERELELSKAFVNGYDPRERWWGVEVAFEPGLDDVFGVTNNKQAATNFAAMDLDEDAKSEGLSPAEFQEQLRENQDPRLAMYEIAKAINRNLRTMRDQIRRLEEGTRNKARGGVQPGSAEDIATKATRRRRNQRGDVGESDRQEAMPIDERIEVLSEELKASGVDSNDARKIAVESVRSNIKFLFEVADIPGTVFFDVRSKAGTIIIAINARHPASEHLFSVLEKSNDDAAPPSQNAQEALKALKLILSAWARMEDEAGTERRRLLEEARQDWGRIARDFLEEAEQ